VGVADIDPLLRAIGDPLEEVRAAAAVALAGLPLDEQAWAQAGPGVAAVLGPWLAAEEPTAEAVEAAACVPVDAVRARLRDLLDAATSPDSPIYTELGRAGAPAAPFLVAELKKPEQWRRERAAAQLSRIASETARETLRTAGADASPTVRFHAAVGLARLGEFEPLELMLEREQGYEREEAAKELRRLSPERAREVLSLSDESPSIRLQAALAHARLGDLQPLELMLEREQGYEREEAAKELRRLSPERAREVLSLSDESPSIRLQAALAHALLGDLQPLEALIREVDRADDRRAARSRFRRAWRRRRAREAPQMDLPLRELSSEKLPQPVVTLLGGRGHLLKAEPELPTPELTRMASRVAAEYESQPLPSHNWPKVLTHLAGRDAANLVTAQFRIALAQPWPGKAVEIGWSVVRLVHELAAPLEPDVSALLDVYLRAPAQLDELERALGWTLARQGLQPVARVLGPWLLVSAPRERVLAARLLRAAAGYAAEDLPPYLGPILTGGGGGGIPRRAHPIPEPPRPESEDRRVNAWLSEGMGDAEGRLVVGHTFTLNLQVGPPVAASLQVDGDATIPAGEIPPGGLETEWVVSAWGIELGSHDATATVTTLAVGDLTTWTARFPLTIPESGSSEVRQLTLTPRAAWMPRLELAIYAGRDLYRQLMVDLAVRHPRVDGGWLLHREPRVAVDVTHTAVAHLGLASTHEWTTPPGQFSLTVWGNGSAQARGEAGVDYVNEPIEWFGTSARVAGAITNVRASAERFRAVHEAYLNDIDPVDLAQRLLDPTRQYDWAGMVDRADGEHRAAWEAVARSKELRELAFDGHALYEAFLPKRSPQRGWLDALSPGWRLDVSWLDTDPNWIPQVPWVLMYLPDLPPAGEPVDPLGFLGLRLRIVYDSHRVPSGSRALGSLAATNRAYLLYWGDNDGRDVTAAEARWQEEQWRSWENQLFLPGTDATDRKAAIMQALESPAPPPVNVLYLFCQCSVGEGNDPVLRFGGSLQPVDVLKRTELGSAALANRPLVFANACTTSAADPYLANELQEGFFRRGCRAYLGTETKIPIVFASRFASIFFHFLYRKVDPEPMAAGEAVAQTRLFLWSHYRNIGGLFYTYVNQYELFVADEAEVLALRLPR